MKRKASAVWNGELKTGKGSISTESGCLSNLPYTFLTRFENGKGTNPEELIAAAHAGCYSMALSAQLGATGIKPEKIETQATITLDKVEQSWSITEILLDVKAKVPGVDPAAFNKAANEAKANCPVSKVLNAKITLNAVLEK